MRINAGCGIALPLPDLGCRTDCWFLSQTHCHFVFFCVACCLSLPSPKFFFCSFLIVCDPPLVGKGNDPAIDSMVGESAGIGSWVGFF